MIVYALNSHSEASWLGGQGGAIAPPSVGNAEIFGNSEIFRKFFISLAFGTKHKLGVCRSTLSNFIHTS